jgi:methylated-DNA-[protein]-cysteine S-methyltransferase
MISYCYTTSPLGKILLTADNEGLVGLYFESQKYYPQVDPSWSEDKDHPSLQTATKQLAEYFAGRRSDFDLPLAPRGTEFQKKVWHELRSIPFGKQKSYGTIATKITGNAKSSRAVGAAVGRNPISIMIPCHRVVGHSGSLTGYAGGVTRKEQLLNLESGTEPLNRGRSPSN